MSLLALPLLLTGCTSAGSPTAEPSPNAAALSHVHGISVDPESSRILLATHDGLYDATEDPAVKISDSTIDLMGFTATAEPNVFYASGHPGPGSSLPNPVGLIRSDDAGKTWEPVSRAGESDFHALTVSGHTIVAFDGQLRTSTDGTNWSTSPATFTPAVLAGSPASTVLLATTENGVQRSTDSGTTWQAVPQSPIIQFAAIAASTHKAPTKAIGVEPNGTVHVSPDAGATWATAGTVEGRVQAITAVEGDTGELTIWVATATGVQVSTDDGVTFRPAAS
ncbi:F510_1955 family glycosylhydrolase [Arthrobacter sp. SDTb3-6]|uniref:F510_1955 family glycosylhydrolase n=1 Tax=Arthrobacter sp. SDTb3-6 TaxID=2713571 RepID=UPI00159DB5AE|nr:exo-alpha-sialidase [Arthrobacter sp. SDTb3-6]NVN00272.1 exo-alpha-sialidase [Arthrobacter sp. SDTb3-6]